MMLLKQNKEIRKTGAYYVTNKMAFISITIRLQGIQCSGSLVLQNLGSKWL
jgi:hypothetical protein